MGSPLERVDEEAGGRRTEPTTEPAPANRPAGRRATRVRWEQRVAAVVIAAECVLAVFLGIALSSGSGSATEASATDSYPAEGPAALAQARPAALLPAAGPPVAPRTCTVNIKSTPSEATLTIDGIAVGTTPLAVVGASCDVPVSIAVEKVGYAGWLRQVELAPGEPTHVHAALTRPQVKLRISSSPTGAQVAVNDKPVGKTPLAVEVSAFVDATVLLQMKGYKTHRVTLAPRASTEISAVLQPFRGPPKKLVTRRPR